MERRNFAQILKEANVDIRREYDRLYSSFYLQKTPDINGTPFSLHDFCSANFINIPFCGTCLSLDDFDESHKLYFEKAPKDFDINYLISFCEYTYNLVLYLQPFGVFGMAGGFSLNQLFLQQVQKVIDLIGYMASQTGGVTIFVPKSQAAISASEIVDPSLSYKVIEYNHHTLQGNIEGKKAILMLLIEKLSPERSKLKQINGTMEDNLFFLFNNLNLRHPNCDKQSKDFKPYVASMSKKDMEWWYDEIYQLCLLALLELDNTERNAKIKELKKNITTGR